MYVNFDGMSPRRLDSRTDRANRRNPAVKCGSQRSSRPRRMYPTQRRDRIDRCL